MKENLPITRFVFIALPSICGAFCIGIVALFFFTSGSKHSLANSMNNMYFLPHADADVDELIEHGVFTSAQKPDVRIFVRRIYCTDCAAFIIGTVLGIFSLGIAFLSAAYSVWLSYRLSCVLRMHAAKQITS